MATKFQTLLENISAENDPDEYSYSEKKPGAGYSRRASGLHTSIYKFNNFSGSVVLQGTLTRDPEEKDWVDIINSDVGGDSSDIGTQNITRNFSGNFLWVRCKYSVTNGTITQISFGF